MHLCLTLSTALITILKRHTYLKEILRRALQLRNSNLNIWTWVNQQTATFYLTASESNKFNYKILSSYSTVTALLQKGHSVHNN